MSLSSQKRKKIYIKTAQLIDASNNMNNKMSCCSYGPHGACCYLHKVSEINFNLLESTFPEFYIFKPETYFSLWWDAGNKEARVTALLLAAEMCND